MCIEKKIVLAVVLVLALLIIFMGSKNETLKDVTTIDLNGMPVKVNRNQMGWLTSGADLREQSLFTSTNQ